MSPRRKSFNKGRWAIQRERCRVSDFVPPADGEESSMSDVVPGIMRRLGLEADVWLEKLEEDWVAVIGETVAAHARPGRYDRGYLTIYIDNSTWLNELKRFGQPEIQSKLQHKYGADKIRGVRLQLDPEGSSGSRPSSTR